MVCWIYGLLEGPKKLERNGTVLSKDLQFTAQGDSLIKFQKRGIFRRGPLFVRIVERQGHDYFPRPSALCSVRTQASCAWEQIAGLQGLWSFGATFLYAGRGAQDPVRENDF